MTLLSDLLAPGVALMQRLRLAAKITLIGALIAVPLAALTWMRASDQAAEYRVARDELRGANVVRALVAVAVQTQVHRGQTHLAMSGNEGVKQALPDTRKKLAAALAAVEPALADTPAEWGLAAQWKPLREVLAGYTEGRHGSDRAADFAEHTRQVQALHMLVQRTAETSGLMLDPVSETFYLMDLAVDRILPWTEAAGLLRGQGAGLLAGGDATPQELAQLAGRIALVEEQAMMARGRVEALERAGVRKPSAFTAAEDTSRALVEAARAGFTQGKPQGEPAAWFAQGARAIEAVVALEEEVNERLVSRLSERAASLNRQRWLGLGFAGLGLLAFLWAGTAFYRSTLIALHQVERVVRASAEGDLTQHARVPGTDEFAGMAQSLSAMSRQLGGLVGAIRDTAAEVSRTGERIADDSRDLSDRTSRQAASVEESAATLEQVAQTVRQNGQNVEQVDRLFQQVQQVVQTGGERMRAVVGTMEQIEGTSRRVGEIITVIDGIAFQTNILALNAAVEAARAGEAGRGFAVVAAEVRTLAQRSASAAAEIRQLIQDSGAQVGQGVAQIHGTRDTLAGLGEQVGMVAQALDQLATATREQTDAVAQVSEAVRQIDETTQSNARSVEAAAANAVALREQAEHLQALVGRLKVTQTAEPV